MKHYLKIIAIFLLRVFLKALYVFPVKKNRILFSSYKGKNYGCNPKYIFEYLYEKHGTSFEYAWCIDTKDKLPADYKISYFRSLSLKHLFYLCTSRVIVSNVNIEPFFVKRKEQLVINTWHGGGAYKKGQDYSFSMSKGRIAYINVLKKLRLGQTNYVLSSCRAFSELLSSAFFMNIDINRFLPIGMPRNDLFFQDKEDLKNSICEKLNIDRGEMIVLYAPTFRGDWNAAHSVDNALDPLKICSSVKERFGKNAIFLYRHHPNVTDDSLRFEEVKDVSDYQDMQELLLIADIFITDYSSSVWDFSLTGKPGFLYTPDLHKYKHDIDFHTPIELWPYPYSLTTEELCQAILDYDEVKAHEKIRKHHELLGSYEDGHATKKACKVIEERMMRDL